jgi:ATP-binding cassette subfamily B protein
MLALSWRYRWGCIRLLVLQGLLLGTGLAALDLSGVGIDVILFRAGAAKHIAAYPLGFVPPTHWPALVEVSLIAGMILALAIVRGWLNYVYAVDSGRLIHEKIVVDLRAQVYDKMQRLSFRFFDANSTGALINRVTGDVQSVRAFVDGVLIQLVILVLSLVCYLVYMLRIDAGLTLACLATTPVLWIVTVVFSRLVRPAYDRTRELIDQVVLTLAENIQAVHVVKGFGREREEIAKFASAVQARRRPAAGDILESQYIYADHRPPHANERRGPIGLWRLAGHARPNAPGDGAGCVRRPAHAIRQPGRQPHQYHQQHTAELERRPTGL